VCLDQKRKLRERKLKERILNERKLVESEMIFRLFDLSESERKENV
jgi:hypothetical protein